MASALRLVRVPLRRMSYAKHIEEETRHAAGNIHSNTPVCYFTSHTRFTGAMYTWKKISFFVVVPALAYCTYNAYAKEKEHEKHIEEHGRHFIAYPHLRIRTKASNIFLSLINTVDRSRFN